MKKKQRQSKPKKQRDVFIHKATRLEFIIPWNVTNTEAALLIRSHIKTRKKQLFETWKRQYRNRGWEGDEKQKTKELFNQYTEHARHLGTQIFLCESIGKEEE